MTESPRPFDDVVRVESRPPFTKCSLPSTGRRVLPDGHPLRVLTTPIFGKWMAPEHGELGVAA